MGKCVRCGKPAETGSNLCQDCRLDGKGTTYIYQEIEQDPNQGV